MATIASNERPNHGGEINEEQDNNDNNDDKKKKKNNNNNNESNNSETKTAIGSNMVTELKEKYKKEFPKGTPLVCACEKGRLGDVKLLLWWPGATGSNGSDNMTLKEMVNQVGKRSDGSKYTPLNAAAKNGAIINLILNILLDGITDANNLADEYKKLFPKGTPLVCACEKGRFEDVKLLLWCHGANGSNGNMTLKEIADQVGRNSGGWKRTPLMAAARYEHLHVVQYLIEEVEADPNIYPLSGRNRQYNALHLAARYNKRDTALIQLLLIHMPIGSINKTSSRGNTPTDKAYDNDNPIRQEIVALLRSKGGKANYYDANGNESSYGNGDLNDLHKAIESENVELVRKLLNEDDISIRGYMSNCPWKSLSRYAIDVLNLNIYIALVKDKRINPYNEELALVKDKRINPYNEEFEIDGKINLHYICEMKVDQSKEDKHLELTKYIYNQTLPIYRDAMGRDRDAIIRCCK